MSALKSLRLIVTNLISFCCYCYIWLMCPVEVKNHFPCFCKEEFLFALQSRLLPTPHAKLCSPAFTCLTLENLYLV